MVKSTNARRDTDPVGTLIKLHEMLLAALKVIEAARALLRLGLDADPRTEQHLKRLEDALSDFDRAYSVVGREPQKTEAVLREKNSKGP